MNIFWLGSMQHLFDEQASHAASSEQLLNKRMLWVSSINLKDQPSHMDVEFWSELTNLETMFLWKSRVIFNCKSELSEFIYYNLYQCITACCACRHRIRITVRHETTMGPNSTSLMFITCQKNTMVEDPSLYWHVALYQWFSRKYLFQITQVLSTIFIAVPACHLLLQNILLRVHSKSLRANTHNQQNKVIS